MATTEITQSVKDVTNLSTLSTHTIEDAQRFVVSNVPKNLLKFAQNASSASTDGSAISFVINDSILDVQRNGYSCREIGMEEAIWALDSTSLKYATAKHPVWYHKQGAVHFAPVTDGSNAGYVFYVDSSKIDDSCDLRNAVIYKAASHEYSTLAGLRRSTLSTAFVAMVASLTQAKNAADSFEDSTESVFGDEDTFLTSNSQLTRVKDAVDKVSTLIESDKPASGYDAHDLLQAEDIELLNGNLSIVKSELERAQVHLAEWVAVGDMRVKEVNTALAEAQGFAGEITSRLSQQQSYINESKKFYDWSRAELQNYIGTNERAIRYQGQQQQAQAAASQ